MIKMLLLLLLHLPVVQSAINHQVIVVVMMAANELNDEALSDKMSRLNDLQDFLEDRNCRDLLNKIFGTLENDPLFRVSEEEITGQMSIDEMRHLAHLRMKKWLEYRFVTVEMAMENPLIKAYVEMNAGMLGYGWGILARNGLNANVCVQLFIAYFGFLTLHDDRIKAVLQIHFP